MKVIIAGSRDLNPSIEEITKAVEASGYQITEVVSGNCKGVDMAGEAYAKSVNLPLKLFPAEWKKYSRLAGPVRNSKMAVYADALIAFPGGVGTNDMVTKMKDQGKPIFRWEPK